MNAIECEIGRSKILCTAFVIAAAFALLCLLLSELPAEALLSGAFLWGVMVWRSWRDLFGSGRCVSIRQCQDGMWQVLNADGEESIASLQLSGCFVQPWLVILCFKQRGRFMRRHVPVFRDSVEAEPFRHLRIYLRWYASGT